MKITADQVKAFSKERPVELAVNEVPITTAQEPLWAQSRAKFLSEAPGFCFILFQMMNPRRKQQKAVFTHDVPIAGTDGLYMYLNPSTWFKYTLSERVFIMAHEVMHSILNHAIAFHAYRMRGTVPTPSGGTLPYIEDVMQVAADYIINAALGNPQGKIGEVPRDCAYDPTFIPHTDSLITAYEKLYKKSDGGTKGLPKNAGVVLRPGTGDGKSAGEAIAERSDQEWKTATAAAMASAKAQGKLSGALSEMFNAVLEPQVSWQEYIMGWFQRKMGGGSYNFRRPDRHMITRKPAIYAPSRAGHGAELVVVAADSSGSIGPKTVGAFMGELAGVLEDVNPSALWVVWCDAKVQRTTRIEDLDDIRAECRKGAPGRGGTSFRPVFDWVKKQGMTPDALVYLTDLEGTFPSQDPGYPVLWGATKHRAAPFGETVYVPNAD